LDTQRIVSELKARRSLIDQAIAALGETAATPATTESSRSGAQAPRKRHYLTGAGREAIICAAEKAMGGKKEEYIRPKIMPVSNHTMS
jgi:hypothetical protein